MNRGRRPCYLCKTAKGKTHLSNSSSYLGNTAMLRTRDKSEEYYKNNLNAGGGRLFPEIV
jgi:hypothetical protein